MPARRGLNSHTKTSSYRNLPKRVVVNGVTYELKDEYSGGQPQQERKARPRAAKKARVIPQKRESPKPEVRIAPAPRRLPTPEELAVPQTTKNNPYIKTDASNEEIIKETLRESRAAKPESTVGGFGGRFVNTGHKGGITPIEPSSMEAHASSRKPEPVKVPKAASSPPKPKVDISKIFDDKRITAMVKSSVQAEAEDEIQKDRAHKLEREPKSDDDTYFVTNATSGFKEDLSFWGLNKKLKGEVDADQQMIQRFDKFRASRLQRLQLEIRRHEERSQEEWRKRQNLIETVNKIRALPEDQREAYYGSQYLTKDGKETQSLRRELESMRWQMERESSDARTLTEEYKELSKQPTQAQMEELTRAAQKELDADATRTRESAERKVQDNVKNFETSKRFVNRALESKFGGVAEPERPEDYRLSIDYEDERYVIKYTANTIEGRHKQVEVYAGDYGQLVDITGDLIPTMKSDMKEYWKDGDNKSKLPNMEWSEAARNKALAEISSRYFKAATGATEKFKDASKKEVGKPAYTNQVRLITKLTEEFQVENNKIVIDNVMDSSHIALMRGTIDVSELGLKDGWYTPIGGGELGKVEDRYTKTGNPIPKLSFTADVEVDRASMIKSLKDIESTSDQVRMTAAEKSLLLSGKSDAGEGAITLSTDNAALLRYHADGEPTATYNIGYVADFLRYLPPEYKTVRVQFDNKKPLKLTAKSDSSKDEIEYWLAPKIES